MFHGKYKVKIAWKKNVHQIIIVPTLGIITYDPSNWDWYEYIPQFSIAFSWLFFAFKIQLDKLSAFANTLPCHRKETMLNMDVTDYKGGSIYMKTFLAQHLSLWGGMFCLAMYLYSEKILFAIGFIGLFLINTCIALYKHAEFVIYTQKQREEFEQEMEAKHNAVK